MAQKLTDAVPRFYKKDEHPLSDRIYLWLEEGLQPL